MVSARFDMIFAADTKTAKANIASLQGQMVAMAATASGITTTLSGIAKAGIAVFLGVTAAVAGSIAVMADYNQALVNSAAIGDLTVAQTALLSDQMKELGITYGQSIVSIAEGSVVLTKAGLTQEEIAMSMEKIVQLMRANNIEFETAAEISIFAVKQFGGEEGFGALPRILDKIQKVTQEAILDVGDMQQAFQYAGSTAVLANIPLEVMLSSMGTLSQRAMEAGVASRSLNMMFLSMIDNIPELEKFLKAYNMEVDVIKDGTINIDGIVRAYDNADDSLKFLIDSQEIFTKRGLRSWGLLLSGGEDYVEFMDVHIPNSMDTLNQVALDQMEGLSSKLGQLKEMLRVAFITDDLQGKADELIAGLTDPVKRLANILNQNLMQFFDWTIANGDKILDVFLDFLTILSGLIAPLYNIGKLFFNLSSGVKKFLFHLILLKKLNYFGFLKQSTQLMFQHWQMQTLQNAATNQGTVAKNTNQTATWRLMNATTQNSTALSRNAAAAFMMVTADKAALLAKMQKANADRIETANVETLTWKTRLYNILLGQTAQKYTLVAMAAMNAAMAMGMATTAAYMMAKATGEEPSGGIIAMNAMMGAGMGFMMTPGPLWGKAIGAGVGAIAMGGGTYLAGHLGAKDYEEPKMGQFNKELTDLSFNLDKVGNTEASSTSTIKTFGSGGSISRDQLAMLHEGERVLTKEENEPQGDIIHIHINNSVIGIDDIVDEIDRARKRRARGID